LSTNEESANVVVAVTAYGTAAEVEMQVHAVPVARPVVVEPHPETRWKAVVAHTSF
jgi:hypothetical protein